jgi:hypothetical protein
MEGVGANQKIGQNPLALSTAWRYATWATPAV